MTIDEAIKHCLEVAEEQERKAQCMGRQFVGTAIANFQNDCFECAADHRQFAEWLTDYKELKNSISTVKLSDIKEALELIRDYKADNIEQKKLIAEYKRLLKLAVEDFAVYGALKDLSSEQRVQNPDWRRFNRVFDILDHQWRYADEALKLIES